MSVAKCFIHDGEEFWFNYKNPVATVTQLELLADLSGTPIDDLLDMHLPQKEVARRLFETRGLVPQEVLEARRKAKQQPVECRWCKVHGLECEGRSTRHHYVPRYLMLELENYQAYAPRRLCTIPLCVGSHRALHQNEETDKSIYPYLTRQEKDFAQKMLTELREQHPAIWELTVSGDRSRYEACLMQDYLAGHFRHQSSAEDTAQRMAS